MYEIFCRVLLTNDTKENGMKKLNGIIPPLTTPINEKEDVLEEELRFLVNLCLSNNFDGLFIAGTSGESMALNQEQRTGAIKIVINEAKGKIPVICGVMDTSTRRVIENIHKAEEVGGTIFAITPVFYTNAATQDEIVRHFEIITQNTKGKILVYNQPQFTNVSLTVKTMQTLSKIDNLIGIKDSSNNWQLFTEMLYMFKDTDFLVFQGITELAGYSILFGADGFIPVFGPLFPKMYKQLYNYALQGNVEQTLTIQNKLNSVSKLLKLNSQTIKSSKIGLSQLFSLSPILCEPQLPCNGSETDFIKRTIEDYRKEFGE